jgi:hypothetical protein
VLSTAQDSTLRPAAVAAAGAPAAAAAMQQEQQADSGSDQEAEPVRARAAPYRISRLRRATDGRTPVGVAAGAFHSLVLMRMRTTELVWEWCFLMTGADDGTVYAFGRGDSGQLGLGSSGASAHRSDITWVAGLRGQHVRKVPYVHPCWAQRVDTGDALRLRAACGTRPQSPSRARCTRGAATSVDSSVRDSTVSVLRRPCA